MNEDELGQDAVCEPDRVSGIVKQMQDEGYAPAVLVFLAADGRVRTLFRDGLDVNAVLTCALDSQAQGKTGH